MGDPALKKENDPLAIEGLEDVFEVAEPGSAPRNQIEEPSSEPLESVGSQAVEVVSTEEAARRLGISSRAVIKRLKNGSLKGFRDDSKQRAEWRIYWKEPSSEPKLSGSFNGPTQGTASGTSSAKGTPGTVDQGTSSSSYLVELNKELLEQMQALTYRNGYLEAQLSERDKDVAERDEKLRLLTDSQHKKHGWSRFWSWFMGR